MEIHQAILEGDLKRVHALIEAGANLNEQDSKYYAHTPLSLAVSLNNLEIVQVLLEAGANLFPGLLTIIAENDFSNPEILAALIEAGIDVNAKLEDGTTILMEAAASDNLEVVKMLIHAQADPNIVSRKANFALLAAGHARNQELFEYLIPLTSPKLRAVAAEQLPTWLAKLISKYDC
ncbi:MAG TPA: hypothetical protein DDW76_36540 [Cyanobacteria bacterium UBA11369]|nr:hypothetical protein [Cyanobacteria bacterium UBA11371]HBE36866.1 hypothetical protein [Cyanobacteria bacterium UBA11368]HBE54115.1 hypothetical protein [Cyanobacteria bacterium UBA11369]